MSDFASGFAGMRRHSSASRPLRAKHSLPALKSGSLLGEHEPNDGRSGRGDGRKAPPVSATAPSSPPSPSADSHHHAQNAAVPGTSGTRSGAFVPYASSFAAGPHSATESRRGHPATHSISRSNAEGRYVASRASVRGPIRRTGPMPMSAGLPSRMIPPFSSTSAPPEVGMAASSSISAFSRQPYSPASTRYFIVAVPPVDLASDTGHLRSPASSLGAKAMRRGSLLPLYPTLGGQLYAIAREYGLPSIGGLCLFLCDDGDGNLGPHIGEESWGALWAQYFVEDDEEIDDEVPHHRAPASVSMADGAGEGIGPLEGFPSPYASLHRDRRPSAATSSGSPQLEHDTNVSTTTESDEARSGSLRHHPHHHHSYYNHHHRQMHPGGHGGGASGIYGASPQLSHRSASRASRKGGMAASRPGRLPIVARLEWAVDKSRAAWWGVWTGETPANTVVAPASSVPAESGGGFNPRPGGTPRYAGPRRSLHLQGSASNPIPAPAPTRASGSLARSASAIPAPGPTLEVVPVPVSQSTTPQAVHSVDAPVSHGSILARPKALPSSATPLKRSSGSSLGSSVRRDGLHGARTDDHLGGASADEAFGLRSMSDLKETATGSLSGSEQQRGATSSVASESICLSAPGEFTSPEANSLSYDVASLGELVRSSQLPGKANSQEDTLTGEPVPLGAALADAQPATHPAATDVGARSESRASQRDQADETPAEKATSTTPQPEAASTSPPVVIPSEMSRSSSPSMVPRMAEAEQGEEGQSAAPAPTPSLPPSPSARAPLPVAGSAKASRAVKASDSSLQPEAVSTSADASPSALSFAGYSTLLGDGEDDAGETEAGTRLRGTATPGSGDEEEVIEMSSSGSESGASPFGEVKVHDDIDGAHFAPTSQGSVPLFRATLPEDDDGLWRELHSTSATGLDAVSNGAADREAPDERDPVKSSAHAPPSSAADVTALPGRAPVMDASAIPASLSPGSPATPQQRQQPQEFTPEQPKPSGALRRLSIARSSLVHGADMSRTSSASAVSEWIRKTASSEMLNRRSLLLGDAAFDDDDPQGSRNAPPGDVDDAASDAARDASGGWERLGEGSDGRASDGGHDRPDEFAPHRSVEARSGAGGGESAAREDGSRTGADDTELDEHGRPLLPPEDDVGDVMKLWATKVAPGQTALAGIAASPQPGNGGEDDSQAVGDHAPVEALSKAELEKRTSRSLVSEFASDQGEGVAARGEEGLSAPWGQAAASQQDVDHAKQFLLSPIALDTPAFGGPKADVSDPASSPEFGKASGVKDEVKSPHLNGSVDQDVRQTSSPVSMERADSHSSEKLSTKASSSMLLGASSSPSMSQTHLGPHSPGARSGKSSSTDLSDTLLDMERALQLLSPATSQLTQRQGHRTSTSRSAEDGPRSASDGRPSPWVRQFATQPTLSPGTFGTPSQARSPSRQQSDTVGAIPAASSRRASLGTRTASPVTDFVVHAKPGLADRPYSIAGPLAARRLDSSEVPALPKRELVAQGDDAASTLKLARENVADDSGLPRATGASDGKDDESAALRPHQGYSDAGASSQGSRTASPTTRRRESVAEGSALGATSDVEGEHRSRAVRDSRSLSWEHSITSVESEDLDGYQIRRALTSAPTGPLPSERQQSPEIYASPRSHRASDLSSSSYSTTQLQDRFTQTSNSGSAGDLTSGFIIEPMPVPTPSESEVALGGFHSRQASQEASSASHGAPSYSTDEAPATMPSREEAHTAVARLLLGQSFSSEATSDETAPSPRGVTRPLQPDADGDAAPSELDSAKALETSPPSRGSMMTAQEQLSEARTASKAPPTPQMVATSSPVRGPQSSPAVVSDGEEDGASAEEWSQDESAAGDEPNGVEDEHGGATKSAGERRSSHISNFSAVGVVAGGNDAAAVGEDTVLVASGASVSATPTPKVSSAARFETEDLARDTDGSPTHGPQQSSSPAAPAMLHTPIFLYDQQLEEMEPLAESRSHTPRLESDYPSAPENLTLSRQDEGDALRLNIDDGARDEAVGAVLHQGARDGAEQVQFVRTRDGVLDGQDAELRSHHPSMGYSTGADRRPNERPDSMHTSVTKANEREESSWQSPTQARPSLLSRPVQTSPVRAAHSYAPKPWPLPTNIPPAGAGSASGLPTAQQGPQLGMARLPDEIGLAEMQQSTREAVREALGAHDRPRSSISEGTISRSRSPGIGGAAGGGPRSPLSAGNSPTWKAMALRRASAGAPSVGAGSAKRHRSPARVPLAAVEGIDNSRGVASGGSGGGGGSGRASPVAMVASPKTRFRALPPSPSLPTNPATAMPIGGAGLARDAIAFGGMRRVSSNASVSPLVSPLGTSAAVFGGSNPWSLRGPSPAPVTSDGRAGPFSDGGFDSTNTRPFFAGSPPARRGTPSHPDTHQPSPLSAATLADSGATVSSQGSFKSAPETATSGGADASASHPNAPKPAVAPPRIVGFFSPSSAEPAPLPPVAAPFEPSGIAAAASASASPNPNDLSDFA